MPFNAVTVFAQFFKNKELLNSGIIMIVASIVFGAVSTFVPLYTVSLGFANAESFDNTGHRSCCGKVLLKEIHSVRWYVAS